LEEAAYCDKGLIDEVVVPLLSMRSSVLLCISTLLDTGNHYSRMMSLVDDFGNAVFKNISITLVCGANTRFKKKLPHPTTRRLKRHSHQFRSCAMHRRVPEDRLSREVMLAPFFELAFQNIASYDVSLCVCVLSGAVTKSRACLGGSRAPRSRLYASFWPRCAHAHAHATFTAHCSHTHILFFVCVPWCDRTRG
jgi:hypothetical protein